MNELKRVDRRRA